jgi:NAD(P)-dependent dehydrogenase (short-subunit alcohol dehydrogenase family)
MTILIAGASRGIGLALCHLLLQQQHRVLALSRNTSSLEALSKTYPGQLSFLSIDLGKMQDETPRLQEWLKQQSIQQLDRVVYNAGYLVNKNFELQSYLEIQNQININFTGAMLLLQQLRPYLKQGSHVVTISSMGGFQGSQKFPGLAVYSASKGALAVLSECLAQEWQEAGIYVNSLALGAVQTEMLQEAFPGYQAPLSAEEAAAFIADFCLHGHRFFNGKILPVSVSTP